MRDGNDPKSISLFEINNSIREPANGAAARAGFAGQSQRGMALNEEQRNFDGIEESISEQRSRSFVRCRRLNEFFSGEAMIDDALHAIGSGPRP